MFYTDFIEGRKIIRSDLLSGVEHFFTTRELCLFSKEADTTITMDQESCGRVFRSENGNEPTCSRNKY